MGIKDRVINILFDEEESDNTSKTDKLTRSKHEDTSSLNVDTAPIFIDVNPRKSTPNKETSNTSEINKLVEEIKQDDTYRMTENISPIFGVQKNDGKGRKASQKKNDNNAMYNGLVNAGITSSTSSYSSVIISPIYGPIENKPTRKSSVRTQKKQADPFTRSIDDTGEFKTLYSEEKEDTKEEVLDFEPEAPTFEEVKEEKPAVDEKLGDTDRLSKISDRINQIKNEAAHIYSAQGEHVEETRHEASKKEVHSSISDLIHNFQKEDFTPDFSILNRKPQEETIPEPVLENEIEEETFEAPLEESHQDIVEPQEVEEPIEKAPLFDEPKIEDTTQLSLEDTLNQTTEKTVETPSSSIDDIFDDDVEDGKDLFSDLFGDE